MDNIKLGLLCISIGLNVYLLNVVKTQGRGLDMSMNSISDSIKGLVQSSKEAPAAPVAGSGASISDEALQQMVKEAVNVELTRTSQATVGYSTRLSELQVKVENLQAKFAERAQNAGHAGGGKGEKIKEEAAKLKAEILSACAK